MDVKSSTWLWEIGENILEKIRRENLAYSFYIFDKSVQNWRKSNIYSSRKYLYWNIVLIPGNIVLILHVNKVWLKTAKSDEKSKNWFIRLLYLIRARKILKFRRILRKLAFSEKFVTTWLLSHLSLMENVHWTLSSIGIFCCKSFLELWITILE